MLFSGRVACVAAVMSFLLLVAGVSGCSDTTVGAADTSASVTCPAFDVRCLPCEASGEGTLCWVAADAGTCMPLRAIVGPQVKVIGMRCRVD